MVLVAPARISSPTPRWFSISLSNLLNNLLTIEQDEEYRNFGAPGAGKGTQSDFIVEKYALTHISTGDLLRKEIADQTELGKRIKSIMDAGQLVSDDIVIEMIDNAIARDTKGILFDGFPATLLRLRFLTNCWPIMAAPLLA